MFVYMHVCVCTYACSIVSMMHKYPSCIAIFYIHTSFRLRYPMIFIVYSTITLQIHGKYVHGYIHTYVTTSYHMYINININIYIYIYIYIYTYIYIAIIIGVIVKSTYGFQEMYQNKH